MRRRGLLRLLVDLYGRAVGGTLAAVGGGLVGAFLLGYLLRLLVALVDLGWRAAGWAG